MAPVRSLIFLLTIVAALGVWRPASGDEPVRPFLDALRERRWFDEALDYLESLQNNPRLSDAVRQSLLYEQGATTLASAAQWAEPEARAAQFARAAEYLERFLQEFPAHELASSAKNQLGNILIERGREALHAARQSGNQESAITAARKLFEQARQQLKAAEQELDGQLQKLPKLVDPSQTEVQNRKRQLASDLAQVKLLRASIDYELSKTYPASSPAAHKHLLAAAQNYAEIFPSYRTRAAGLLARLWEGRCYQELGEFKKALGCFVELIELPTSPETRVVKTKATRHALECWTKDSQQKYQEAIEHGERWDKENGAGQSDADALAIRYLTALAYQGQSKSLPAKDPNRKKLAGVARQYVTTVARHPGEYQHPAKMLLVALAGNKNTKDADSGPTTFAEGFELARQALERLQEISESIGTAQAKGESDVVQALEPKKREAAAQSLAAVRQAIGLADAKTPLEDLNSARYYLCFLLWDAGRLQDTAVLGDFLARRYPDGLPGRQGARLALAAYLRLYNECKDENKSFETEQLQRMADYIFKTWPEGEETEEAALTMLNFAASQRQYARSLEYLGKISPNSPRRAWAEMRAGQSFWAAYLRSLQMPPDARPPQAELEELKKKAQETLEQGLSRAEKSNQVDATLAGAVLSLAQLDLEAGQVDKAIGWLENPKIGPLALVKTNSPAAAREGFATETYKLALRAYIAVQPQQLKQAEETMNALEKLVQGSGDAKAAENLTAIYVSLGRELEAHLQELRKSGKTSAADSVSRAFEVFLQRVVSQPTGKSYGALNWVGETYFTLAGAADEAGYPAKAKEQCQQAAKAYRELLDLAKDDPQLQGKTESLLAIRLRLGECYRRSGNFEEAINTLVSILREKPALLPAQVAAAQTYQAQGAIDAKSYAKSINGSTPGRDGKNIVWGWARLSKLIWNKISNAAENNPKIEETFHLARLNMADARQRYALSVEDQAQRAKILDTAKQDLWMTYSLRKSLGGPATTEKYEHLLKQIQHNLGQQEVGLVEFKEREAAAKNTDAK